MRSITVIKRYSAGVYSFSLDGRFCTAGIFKASKIDTAVQTKKTPDLFALRYIYNNYNNACCAFINVMKRGARGFTIVLGVGHGIPRGSGSLTHSTIGHVAIAHRAIRHIKLRTVRLDTLHLHTIHLDTSSTHRSIGHCCFWTPYTILHNLKYMYIHVCRRLDIFINLLTFYFINERQIQ